MGICHRVLSFFREHHFPFGCVLLQRTHVLQLPARAGSSGNSFEANTRTGIFNARTNGRSVESAVVDLEKDGIIEIRNTFLNGHVSLTQFEEPPSVELDNRIIRKFTSLVSESTTQPGSPSESTSTDPYTRRCPQKLASWETTRRALRSGGRGKCLTTRGFAQTTTVVKLSGRIQTRSEELWRGPGDGDGVVLTTATHYLNIVASLRYIAPLV